MSSSCRSAVGLLGVGGHLHDYGVRVRLEDAESGKVLAEVVATRDSAGKVSKVSRKLFGVTGDGLKLKGDHRYRVVGEYENPTGQTLIRGAMAHMSGLFAPDDMSDWPKIDASNPDYRRDLVSLQVNGTRAERPTLSSRAKRGPAARSLASPG